MLKMCSMADMGAHYLQVFAQQGAAEAPHEVQES